MFEPELSPAGPDPAACLTYSHQRTIPSSPWCRNGGFADPRAGHKHRPLDLGGVRYVTYIATGVGASPLGVEAHGFRTSLMAGSGFTCEQVDRHAPDDGRSDSRPP